MQILPSNTTATPDNTAVATSATQANLKGASMIRRKTPVRQRAVLERDVIESQNIAGFARQSEGRRDRRADRMFDTPDDPKRYYDGQALYIFGRTATGRRFRVRFIPKEIDNAPIAREA